MGPVEMTNPAASSPPTATSAVRLVFSHGVANLTIRVDRTMAGIYHGAFVGPQPEVTESADGITIDYPRFNPFVSGRTAADITLSPSARWLIAIEGGVSSWSADLVDLELAGIEVRGGVSKAELRLPKPNGSVSVRISGGASNLAIHRPAGVASSLRIGGGAAKLTLDTQQLGAVGGPIRLETPDYRPATARYDIEIEGGASRITVDQG